MLDLHVAIQQQMPNPLWNGEEGRSAAYMFLAGILHGNAVRARDNGFSRDYEILIALADIMEAGSRP